MGVGVEGADQQDLVQEAAQQRAGQLVPVVGRQ
jgi:orotidine-5'-phosphate decarboxylase